MKFFRHENQIVSLTDVKQVILHESTTQHTSYGRKYDCYHYHIRIDYKNNEWVTIDCPDDNKSKAVEIFENIFELLNYRE